MTTGITSPHLNVPGRGVAHYALPHRAVRVVGARQGNGSGTRRHRRAIQRQSLTRGPGFSGGSPDETPFEPSSAAGAFQITETCADHPSRKTKGASGLDSV